MPAVFHITQGNAGSSGNPVMTDVGIGNASAYEFNFMSTDSNEVAVDYSNYPITAGQNSYEVWVMMRFGDSAGAFSTIDNCKFYTNVPCYTASQGMAVYGNINIANPGGTSVANYTVPTDSNSIIAIRDITTGYASPSAENVYIGTTAGGSITTPASFTANSTTNGTQFIALQVRTTVAAAAGTSSDIVWHYTYDES